MKTAYFLSILFVLSMSLFSALGQNTGVGTSTPTQKLDVAGKIKIGDDATVPQPGTVRWNTITNDFEGYNGTEWLSLTVNNSQPWPVGGANGGLGLVTDFSQATGSDTKALERFGGCVSMSGNMAVVGCFRARVGTTISQGAAFVFSRIGGNWEEIAKLTASDGAFEDFFGASVSISNNYIIVGAPYLDKGGGLNEGSAYIFAYASGVWTQQAQLLASDGGVNDLFGSEVAISGITAIIGAPNKTISGRAKQGAAYIFVRSGTTWSESTRLIASDGVADDNFGSSVSISGSTVVVGAPNADISGKVDQGAAYIFSKPSFLWFQDQKIIASDGLRNDSYGSSVAISGNYIVIGAPFGDVGFDTDHGSVYIYFKNGITWESQGELNALDYVDNLRFGAKVAISGNYIVVGASMADVVVTAPCVIPINMATEAGRTFFYKLQNNIWTLYNSITDANVQRAALFGSAVAVSGEYFASTSAGATINGAAAQGKVIFGRLH